MGSENASLQIVEQASSGAQRRLWSALATLWGVLAGAAIASGIVLDVFDPHAAVVVVIALTVVAIGFGFQVLGRIRPGRGERPFPPWLPIIGAIPAAITRPFLTDAPYRSTVFMACFSIGYWVIVAIMLRRLRGA